MTAALRVVWLLRRLDTLLQQSSTKSFIENAMESRNECYSLRFIQGGRIEIFCRAQKKRTTVFNRLCNMVLQQIKNDAASPKRHVKVSEFGSHFYKKGAVRNAILDYAEKQARKDQRLGQRSYNFDNFSLLLSYGKVEAQTCHLDLQAPNFQFGLVVSDEVAPTLIYQPAYRVGTVENLKRAWPDLPASIATAMEQRLDVIDLLDQFGDLLCPTITQVPLVESTSSELGRIESVAVGTVLSLPGSVMHAGPPSSDFRAIMFFSAWPSDGNQSVDNKDNVSCAVPPYNPDTQYFKPLVISALIILLWEDVMQHNENNDGEYLLTKLAHSILQPGTCKHVYRHIRDERVFRFAKTVEDHSYQQANLNEFISFFASSGYELPQTIGGNQRAGNETAGHMACFSSLPCQVDEILPVLVRHQGTPDSCVFDLVEAWPPFALTVKTTKKVFQGTGKTSCAAHIHTNQPTILRKRALDDEDSKNECVVNLASANVSDYNEVADASVPVVKRSSRRPRLPARLSEYCCIDIPKLHKSLSSITNLNEGAQLDEQCMGKFGNVVPSAGSSEPLKPPVASSVDSCESSDPTLLFNGSVELDAFLKIELSPEKYEQAKTLSHRHPAVEQDKCNMPVNAPLVSMVTVDNDNEAHDGYPSTPASLLPSPSERNDLLHDTSSLHPCSVAQAMMNVPPTDTPLPHSPHLAHLATSLLTHLGQFVSQLAQQTPTVQGPQPTPPQPPSGQSHIGEHSP
jgi:hypothetical protein